MCDPGIAPWIAAIAPVPDPPPKYDWGATMPPNGDAAA